MRITTVFIYLVLFIIFSIPLQADAAITNRTPVAEKQTAKKQHQSKRHKQQLKKQKLHQKKAKPNKQHVYFGGGAIVLFIVLLIVTLLIIGVALKITWLWILMTVLLSIPLILFIIFIIALSTSGDWC